MKKLLLLLVFCGLLSTTMSAQNTWTEVVNQSGITISSKTSQCNYSRGFDEQRIILKFENSTSTDLILEWDYSLSFDGVCATCDKYQEYHRTIVILANSSQEGVCDPNADDRLSLFSKFDDTNYNANTVSNYNPRTLTNFEFTNLTISPN